MFNTHLIRLILRNLVYCGKIAYGRRKTEKVRGTRNEYKLVEQDNYLLADGQHEAIVSEEVWQAAQVKLLAPSIKHRSMIRGHKCDYKKQIREELLDDAVAEVIVKLAEEIDSLDLDDRYCVRRKVDLDDHLYKMYDKIEDTESLLIAARAKKQAVEAERLPIIEEDMNISLDNEEQVETVVLM